MVELTVNCEHVKPCLTTELGISMSMACPLHYTVSLSMSPRAVGTDGPIEY